MKKSITLFFALTIMYIGLTSESSCNAVQQAPESASGVKKISFKVETDLNGNTIEQNNVKKRMVEDNKPGAIKHLYIISAYSGQVLIYSTVKGKVTSSGKRLTPSSVTGDSGMDPNDLAAGNTNLHDNRITIGNSNYVTDEVLGDDGTYGPSVEYIYWWDSKDIYHQQYVAGGLLVHVSSQPISVKSVVINMEETVKQN